MDSSFRPLPPLPTSLPMNGFTTSHDIDYKQIVQSVKLLYLRRQYKQCANLCENHLTDLGGKVIKLTFKAGSSIQCLKTRQPILAHDDPLRRTHGNYILAVPKSQLPETGQIHIKSEGSLTKANFIVLEGNNGTELMNQPCVHAVNICVDFS